MRLDMVLGFRKNRDWQRGFLAVPVPVFALTHGFCRKPNRRFYCEKNVFRQKKEGNGTVPIPLVTVLGQKN